MTVELTDAAASKSGHTASDAPTEPEHLDVLIVGAGISGIGAAHHLNSRRQGARFAVLESKPTFGGT